MELNQSIENPLGAGTQVGQGEAFVFTPNQNIFSTVQNALNQNLALKQADLKEKQEEKKKQDAQLMKIMADIQVDPKWDKSLEEMSQHIDNVGNLVYNWRASGKPVNVEFYTQLNKEIARQNQLKGMNEQTFNQYTKVMADLSTNKDVNQDEVKLWQEGFDKQKNIEGRFDYMNSVAKPNEDFNTLKLFKDNMSEDVQKGVRTFTDEKKQTIAEKAVFDNMSQYEKTRTMNKYSKLAGRDLTEDEVLKAIHEDLKGWYAQKTAPSSSSGLTAAQKMTGVAGVRYGTSSGVADYIALPNDSRVMQVLDGSGKLISMIPSGVQYSGQPNSEKGIMGGWQIEGKVPGNTQTKTFKSKEEADAWTAANEGGTIAEPEFDESTNTLTYKTLETVYVPYDWNITKFKANYPKIDVVQLAQQYNQANGKGTAQYYQLPLKYSTDLNADEQSSDSGQGVNLNADQQGQ